MYTVVYEKRCTAFNGSINLIVMRSLLHLKSYCRLPFFSSMLIALLLPAWPLPAVNINCTFYCTSVLANLIAEYGIDRTVS